MKIETKFDLGEKVQIKELNRHGKIKAIYINRTAITYSVRYFDNAKAEEIYFDEDELEKI